MTYIYYIAAAVFFVVLSGCFAGFETGIYRLTPFRLRLGIEHKRRLYRLLKRLMTDREQLIFSTLLGTNLTHYAATTIITYLLLSQGRFEHTSELYATLIMTPVLFVFAELIPKSIYFYRADYLMGLFSPVIWLFHKIFVFSSAVPMLRIISHGIARISGTVAEDDRLLDTDKHYIQQLIHDSREEGLISPIQNEMLDRLSNISGVHIRSVMTAIEKTAIVDIETDRNALLEILRQTAFTRMPVYKGRRDNIVGFINIYETLCSEKDFTSLDDFLKPIHRLSVNTTITEAISIMRNQDHRIVLVTAGNRSGREIPAGILTMKDLAEELIGELAQW